MATAAKARKGSGKRRRFGGKMVDGNTRLPRSNTHGGHSQANAGFEMGSTIQEAFQTKLLPGRFKVSEPTKRWQRRGIVRRATTGEQTS